jgi:hypothetical protein
LYNNDERLKDVAAKAAPRAGVDEVKAESLQVTENRPLFANMPVLRMVEAAGKQCFP